MLKKIVYWLLLNIFFNDSIVTTLVIPIICIVVLFGIQMFCLKSKKLIVKIIPIIFVIALFALSIYYGIVSQLQNGWGGFAIVFIFMTTKILFFALGNVIAWIVYKKRTIKQK